MTHHASLTGAGVSGGQPRRDQRAGVYDDVRGGMLDAALARLEATAEFDLPPTRPPSASLLHQGHVQEVLAPTVLLPETSISVPVPLIS